MVFLLFVGSLFLIFLVGCAIGARDDARVRATQEPLTLTPNAQGVYSVADEAAYEMRPVRRGSIRARIIFSAWALTLLCVVMAYVTARPDISCPGGGPCTATGTSSANLIWFFFALYPGAVAVFSSFVSWVLTGRPW